MAQAVVVLAAATPPDVSHPLAIFPISSLQDANAATARAEQFKTDYSPTSVVQSATVETYNTNIVIQS